jgi:hypothetical protein
MWELGRSIEILERTPGTLRSLLGGLSEDWLAADEGPDTFSPRDVLGHLIHGEEDDWIPRLQIILRDGESRPFTPFDRFAFRKKLEGKTTPELLEIFADLRRKNLRILCELKLQASQLDLKGTHPELGTVTLRQLIATWVVHDLGHLRQIARVMAKQYREAVGAWRAYLPVLDE